MLELLVIRNVAVIDHAEIPFTHGLNILSGETGAGKSIVLEAIGLLLGGRATSELIRAGCAEASVEGLFDLAALPWLGERLLKLGLTDSSLQEPHERELRSEASQLVIRRTVLRSGKNRIHINGHLATLSTLQEVCDGLIDICGQSEHQSLVKPSVQLEMIDQFCGIEGRVQDFKDLYESWINLKRRLLEFDDTETTRMKQMDFLHFQLAELNEAQLRSGEDEELLKEKALFQSAESRALLAQAAYQRIMGDESDSSSGSENAPNLLETLKGVKNRANQLAELDSTLQPVCDRLDLLFNELYEISQTFEAYIRSIEFDPERLEAIGERLHLLTRLKKKYGASLADVIARMDELRSDLENLETVASSNDQLTQEEAKLRLLLDEFAGQLSAFRLSAGSEFERLVTTELKDLKMERARLQVQFRSLPLGPTGADEVQFLVETNQGEPARPLGRIASGGELSRLMLAIRRVIAGKGNIGVYLFDEIDAGISGQTAFQVGKKLRLVSEKNQVICITHLPQVAAFAHHHLSVQKAELGDRTVTAVVPLTGKERREEVARMLGGPGLTTASRKNAFDLLSLAEQAVSP
jgi:DNA repair protein RecN (Recombination protein N)